MWWWVGGRSPPFTGGTAPPPPSGSDVSARLSSGRRLQSRRCPRAVGNQSHGWCRSCIPHPAGALGSSGYWTGSNILLETGQEDRERGRQKQENMKSTFKLTKCNVSGTAALGISAGQQKHCLRWWIRNEDTLTNAMHRDNKLEWASLNYGWFWRKSLANLNANYRSTTGKPSQKDSSEVANEYIHEIIDTGCK